MILKNAGLHGFSIRISSFGRNGFSMPGSENKNDFALCALKHQVCKLYNKTLRTLWKKNTVQDTYKVSPAENQYSLSYFKQSVLLIILNAKKVKRPRFARRNAVKIKYNLLKNLRKPAISANDKVIFAFKMQCFGSVLLSCCFLIL